MSGQTADDFKDRLIDAVKKQVKQVMEEAVTRKYIHEESGSVTALCATVEACLSQGLRRRALGLFKTSSTTALLHKIGKHCTEAGEISQMVQDIESTDPHKRSSSSGDSTSKPPILKKNSSNSIIGGSSSTASTAPVVRYLWIRLALYGNKLTKIIDHLVMNASRYYEREALVADVDYGNLLSSLLMGPCALEYSKTKTNDHYYTDPPADELVQRHRISSGNPTPPSSHRPIFNFKRSLNASSEDGSSSSFKSTSSTSVAKEYVESLHQNSRETLLYGKNNVMVLPLGLDEPIPGYLTLHQSVQVLTIKWTPNQLMNKNTQSDTDAPVPADKSVYWNSLLSINVQDIVYLHCHQAGGADTGGTIIVVEQDGIQRPPIHFPKGGHMAAFLGCLETGLLPHGQLDPPLWSQRGLGKLFAWPGTRSRAAGRRPLPSLPESVDDAPPVDYVFRIVNHNNHREFREFISKFQLPESVRRQSIVQTAVAVARGVRPAMDAAQRSSSGSNSSDSPRRSHLSSSSTTESSDGSGQGQSLDLVAGAAGPAASSAENGATISLVCSTMRRQIISRAFYGWLAYCRHRTTVRKHLSGLVHGRITPEADADKQGLTEERWLEMHDESGSVSSEAEVLRLSYYGGVAAGIRKQVWPYLLGHYAFGSTRDERAELDDSVRHSYEQKVGAWMAVEAIVRQLDKEKTAQAYAKLSSESSSEKHLFQQQLNKLLDLVIGDDIGDDVFEENAFSDLSDPEECDDDDQQRRGEAQSPTDSDKPSRVNKTSTDSGNVPDEDVLMRTDELDNNAEKGFGSGEVDEINSEKVAVAEEENDEDGVIELDLNSVQQSHNEQSDVEQITFEEVNNAEVIVDELDLCSVIDLAEEIEGAAQQPADNASNKSSPTTSSYETVANDFGDMIEPFAVIQASASATAVEADADTDDGAAEGAAVLDDDVCVGDAVVVAVGATPRHSFIVTDASVDLVNVNANGEEVEAGAAAADGEKLDVLPEEGQMLETLQEPKSALVSPASSSGGVYTGKLLDSFGQNLHRIDKDVHRCDRNYYYYQLQSNLDKLRNVICTYVWENLEHGYMQGMCDIAAPLLVIFDDESLCYVCFKFLMERMGENFPCGPAMDMHLANMRSLIQILDVEMLEVMQQQADFSHFYFCYRWFLLDFKRELRYDDIFLVWEVIWSARHVASEHFVLFMALALLEHYRDIIMHRFMDFTDIVKFFNDMAELHNIQDMLTLARSMVLQLQKLLENQ